jgi:hypothetical protein
VKFPMVDTAIARIWSSFHVSRSLVIHWSRVGVPVSVGAGLSGYTKSARSL